MREAARYVTAPVRRTLLPSSSPYTPYACGTQRALLPVAVCAMNIHDVRDWQTSDRRQTASPLNAPNRPPPLVGRGLLGAGNEIWINKQRQIKQKK